MAKPLGPQIRLRLQTLREWQQNGVPDGHTAPTSLNQVRYWDDASLGIAKIGAPASFTTTHKTHGPLVRAISNVLLALNQPAPKQPKKSSLRQQLLAQRAQFRAAESAWQKVANQLVRFCVDLRNAQRDLRMACQRLEVAEEGGRLPRSGVLPDDKHGLPGRSKGSTTSTVETGHRHEAATPSHLPFFVTTDDGCRIDGVEYPGIPVFFDESGMIEAVSAYFIWLVYDCRKPPSSVRTYAYQVQKFLKYIRGQGIGWEAVSDRVLITWRDGLLQHEQLGTETVINNLSRVFDFYQWAEETNLLRDVVALRAAVDTYDGLTSERTYRISAKPNARSNGFTWPFLPKAIPSPPRHTPTSEEIRKTHVLACRTAVGDRDTLLLSLYEEMYLRRAEALGLTINDIRTADEVADKAFSYGTFEIKIIGKGNKIRYVHALPELMSSARDYVDGERATAVREAKRRNPAYREPDDLFLGATTGQPLTPQYVSRRITHLMRKAGIRRASGHRVRATGLTGLVMSYDGKDKLSRPFSSQTVLLKAADAAGHGSIKSLEPYLALGRTPVHGDEVDTNLQNLRRLRNLQRENARLMAKLGEDESQ